MADDWRRTTSATIAGYTMPPVRTRFVEPILPGRSSSMYRARVQIYSTDGDTDTGWSSWEIGRYGGTYVNVINYAGAVSSADISVEIANLGRPYKLVWRDRIDPRPSGTPTYEIHDQIFVPGGSYIFNITPAANTRIQTFTPPSGPSLVLLLPAEGS